MNELILEIICEVFRNIFHRSNAETSKTHKKPVSRFLASTLSLLVLLKAPITWACTVSK